MIMNQTSVEYSNSRCSNDKIARAIPKNVLVVEAQIDSTVRLYDGEHVGRISDTEVAAETTESISSNLPVFFGRGNWNVIKRPIKSSKEQDKGKGVSTDSIKTSSTKPKTSAHYSQNLDEIIEVLTDEENGDSGENYSGDCPEKSTPTFRHNRYQSNGIVSCDKEPSTHMTVENHFNDKNNTEENDVCEFSPRGDSWESPSNPKSSRGKKSSWRATRCCSSSNIPRSSCANQLANGQRENIYSDSININSSELQRLRSCENCRQPYYSPEERTCYKYSKINNPQLSPNTNYNEENNYELFEERQELPALLTYRSRSLPQLSVHDSGLGSGLGQDNGPGKFNNSKLVTDLRQLLTLKQHYYPESGWGWVIIVVGVFVQILSHGIHGAVGLFIHHAASRFTVQAYLDAGWLGAMSTGVALLISPVTIGFCRRKSTRVTAVLGGLVTALGCLFTSFATQFHQLFFSYGAVVGVGVGITRDCSTLMVAQYFKRKREFVEIFIVSGSGLGIAIMSAFIKSIIGKIGWRLGLQAVTVTVFSTFFLGTFYRSASLYHPQRRAILHLKNQKRKIKEKNKVDDRPPILDFTTLKSKTVRILLLSTGISAFGINTPIFYLAHQIEEEGLGDTVILLQAYLGLGWTVGCVTFGLLVIRQNVECRIARQYLVQTAVFICGICILALTTVHGNYYGYVLFTWIYGIFCGGYHYSLKMYTYERVRARNFVRTWGFVQCSQAIPIAIGVPISGYINISFGNKAGYYFSSTCVLVGSFTLFFIDLHKRNLSKHRSGTTNGIKHTCNSNCPKKRGLSFNQEAEHDNTPGAGAVGFNTSSEHPPPLGENLNKISVDKPELTCISEEGIADMDLPDNILDDIEYIGDCITSCNKVENYLMLSEFENNLIAEMPIIMDRKGRKWSLARSKSIKGNQSAAGPSTSQTVLDEDDIKSKWLLMPAPINNRAITVIEEASTSQVES